MNKNYDLQLRSLTKKIESIEDFIFDVDDFEKLIQEHRNTNPELSDSDVCKTIKGIRKAVKHRNHINSDVRASAERVCISCKSSFNEAQIEANGFFAVLKSAEREADKKSSPKCFELGDDFRLKEVVTFPYLLKMLHAFGCGIKGRERENAEMFLKDIESEKRKIWVLFRRCAPFAMMFVNLESQEIHEFFINPAIDVDKSKEHFGYELLIKILKTLNVSANRMFAFVKCGAFARFAEGEPNISPISVDNSEWWIYYFEDELIIGVDDHNDGNLSWSHFDLHARGDICLGEPTDTKNALTIGELIEAVRINPQLLDRMQVSLAT